MKGPTIMDRKLENNLIAMTPAEREIAIQKLQQIKWEIARYANYFFWEGHGKTQRQTHLTIELGTDVIEFRSNYHESCKNCYYTKSLTRNGKKTTCLLVNHIIERLQELNGPIPQEPIFLDDDIFL